jgi:hypothetical protein
MLLIPLEKMYIKGGRGKILTEGGKKKIVV